MAVLRLVEATWREVHELRDGRIVAILPVGATEAHGPHLPLSTDNIIAEAMATAGGDLLSTQGRDVLILPVLGYTAAPFASGFSGTVTVSPETVTSLVADIAASLAERGVETLAIANAHLDPANLASLYAAAERVGATGAVRFVFPDLTRKPWALRLTEEFLSGACHAGQYEGSIVAAERPDLFRTDIAASLPPNPSSLSDAIRGGRHTFEESGGPEAYFGDPAAATAEEGRRTIEILGGILAEAVLGE